MLGMSVQWSGRTGSQSQWATEIACSQGQCLAISGPAARRSCRRQADPGTSCPQVSGGRVVITVPSISRGPAGGGIGLGPHPGGGRGVSRAGTAGPGLTRRQAGRVKFSQKHCGPEGRPGRDRRTEFDSGGVGPGIEGGHRDSHGTQQPENRCENPEPRRRVRASKSQRALGQSRAGCPLKGHESVVDRHTATSSRPQL